MISLHRSFPGRLTRHGTVAPPVTQPSCLSKHHNPARKHALLTPPRPHARPPATVYNLMRRAVSGIARPSMISNTSANSAHGRVAGGDLERQLDELTKTWAGPSKFVQDRPLVFGIAGRIVDPAGPSTPGRVSRTPSPEQTGSGTVESPISVASSSSTSPEYKTAVGSDSSGLPRPRGVPVYSPLARTAYMPPRETLKVDKPVHPFFVQYLRSKSAPLPPPSQRPRLVAHYSSTTEGSGATAPASTRSQSQSTSYSAFTGRLPDDELAELADDLERMMVQDMPARPVRPLGKTHQVGQSRSAPLPRGESHKAKPAQGKSYKGKWKSTETGPRSVGDSWLSDRFSSSTMSEEPQQQHQHQQQQPDDVDVDVDVDEPFEPVEVGALPIFHYRTYRSALGRPPRTVSTSHPQEADDLVGCLRGRVIGLDLEWPAKQQKVWTRDAQTEQWSVKWQQGKTAVVQLCDDRVVIVIHLKGMKQLPQSVVDILADESKLKIGVAITGDGRKLLRDFPDQFASANPLRSFVELSHLARKADPLGTGPGAALISLANLTRAYLGHELPKDPSVRQSDWSKPLSGEQVDYAANDVWASVNIFHHLDKLATAALGTPLDMSDISITLSSDGSGGAPRKAGGPRSGPTPAQERALKGFISGLTFAEYAQQAQIKVNTATTYICEALSVLPLDTLSEKDKDRFLLQAGDNPLVINKYRRLLGQISLSLGQGTADTEEDATS